MSDALVNAFTVLLIFIIGYCFRRLKFVNLDTARKMSFVVMYMTLPCAILSGTQGAIDISPSLYFIVPLAFIISFSLPFLGYLLYKDTPKRCVFVMLNLGGFNIGNFVLPFMQSILTPEGFIALCLFDVVNAFFCFGGVYCMALWFNRKGYSCGETINIKRIFREMSKSITSYCCILSIVLSAAAVTLPSIVAHPLKVIGSSNTFLCMLLIGMALNFDISFEKVKRIALMIFYRYGMSSVIACAVYMLLPYSAMVKLVIMAMIFAPITSMAPLTAIRCMPEFAEDSANLNMVSVIISAAIITLLNALYPVLTAL